MTGSVAFGSLDHRRVVGGERAGRGVEPELVDGVGFTNVGEECEFVGGIGVGAVGFRPRAEPLGCRARKRAILVDGVNGDMAGEVVGRKQIAASGIDGDVAGVGLEID